MQLFIQWFYEEKSVDPQQVAEWLENLQLIHEGNATKHIFKIYVCGLFLGTFIVMLIRNTYSGKYNGKQINLFLVAWCIMHNWLIAFEKKNEERKKKTALFMNNAMLHPADMKLSNVKAIFFSANVLTQLQNCNL